MALELLKRIRGEVYAVFRTAGTPGWSVCPHDSTATELKTKRLPPFDCCHLGAPFFLFKGAHLRDTSKCSSSLLVNNKFFFVFSVLDSLVGTPAGKGP